MAGKPHVYFTLPSFSLLPEPLPQTLTPPVNEGSIRSPFGIDPWLYNAALRPEVPIIFATTYVISVFALNAYNKSRGNKPWWIARQWFFPGAVVIHNALLALYSLATFLAIFRAAAHTVPSLTSGATLAEYADSLCKMHGPRGFGDATTFNTTINIWEAKNQLIKIGYNGNPDPTDVGRLWNEGLAFWGWLFYVSKFYEVLDTLIILAKGKRSATLQTYHHSGAMLCMWAGIRYMSPPIWMFVFVNSLIHTLMYTYYTIGALNYRVPQALKRTLTTLQIIQILWGVTYAGSHLFIAYDIPVTTPYTVVSLVQNVASSISSVASAASATVSEVIESPPAASGTLVALAKKLLLRAVGEEGIAERVVNKQGELLNPRIAEKIEQLREETEVFETRWRTDLTKINCIDTSGEAFAIWFNLLYLLPLAFLFFRFFIRSYTRRGSPKTASKAASQLSQSGREAIVKAEKVIEQLGSKAEDEVRTVNVGDIREEIRRDVQALKDGTLAQGTKISDQIGLFENQLSEQVQKVTGGSLEQLIPSKRTEDTAAGESAGSKSIGSAVEEDEAKDEAKAEASAEASAAATTSRETVQTTIPSDSTSVIQDESTGKQDANLIQTQDIRPGVDSTITTMSAAPSTSATTHSTEVVPSQSEPETKQDSNIEATQDIRPSPLDGLNGANQQDGNSFSRSTFFSSTNEGGNGNSSTEDNNKLEFSTTSFSSDFADFVKDKTRELGEAAEKNLFAGEGSNAVEPQGEEGEEKPDFPVS